VVALTAACAGPCHGRAQARAPEGRQALGDLAYVLGESHALRQTCRAPGDQYWRDRMLTVLRLESRDLAFRARISRAFNAGFEAGQAAHPTCSAAARAAEAAAAARGEALAEALAAPGH
jgi:uncharacterized protein (TIGR02301 family)